MKKLVLILFFIPTFLFSQEFVDFLPLSTNNGELVNHAYYSLSYSEQHEQAEWVFYEIKKERILGLASRKNNFPIVGGILTHVGTCSKYVRPCNGRTHQIRSS